MGPILIFDKSTLQGLSLDESVWLENFFVSNITPIFFIETLADLSKPNVKRGAAALVAELARKTPQGSSFPNAFHVSLVGNDLVGNTVPMTNQVIVAGGTNKRDPQGKVGTHFEEFDEAAAMTRWQEGRFEEIEQLLAKSWRTLLTNIDFRGRTREVKKMLQVEKVASLDEARERAAEYVRRSGDEVVRLAREFLGIGPQWETEIFERYRQSGNLSLEQFAPYAAFVLRVTLFFHLAMASSLIAKERPSNMVDVAYLYYLPFCNAFVSNDKLHSRTAPLFCEQGQLFVRGTDLKAGLRELNDFYARHEEEIERVGVMRFAPRPPTEMDNAVTRLWDTFAPRWREAQPATGGSAGPEKSMTPDLMVQIKEKAVPVSQDAPQSDPKYAMVTRRMPVRRGRWRLLPPEVEGS